jgi:PilZ domain
MSMDYSAKYYVPQPTTGADQRRSPRKPMRQKISLGTANHGIVQGHTRDISASGLSVMIPVALATNAVCAVRFELMVDGRLIRFSGHGKIVHCSCAGMDGFRVGMQLQLDDPRLLPLLEKFMSV